MFIFIHTYPTKMEQTLDKSNIWSTYEIKNIGHVRNALENLSDGLKVDGWSECS